MQDYVVKIKQHQPDVFNQKNVSCEENAFNVNDYNVYNFFFFNLMPFLMPT